MDARTLATLAATVGLIAGAVWLSATLDRKPQITEATAAAISADMAWFIEIYEDPAERKAVAGKPAPLCIAANEPLDFTLLAERLAGTFLRVIPVAACTSKTVEGDFGMFSAMTTWFDESGEEAGHITIKAVDCRSARRCVVDIDSLGAGMRYEVELEGGLWTVRKGDLRWIV